VIEPTLYTGTHMPAWLWNGQVDFHLFVSHRRLAGYKTLRPARVQWALDSDGYLACAQLYEDAGVHLAGFPVVGVGTVCRIQDTALIGRVARALQPLDLALHWFGVKLSGLPGIWPPDEAADSLTSFDSMAWSYDARRTAPLPGCSGHKNCANCPSAARRWRGRVMASVTALERRGWQDELFTPAGEQASSEAPSLYPVRAVARSSVMPRYRAAPPRTR